MTEKEFIQHLKEDKWTDNPDELIKLRLPIVQYFLSNKSNNILITPNGQFSSKDITIKYNEESDFTLVNYAYEKIRELFIGKREKE